MAKPNCLHNILPQLLLSNARQKSFMKRTHRIVWLVVFCILAGSELYGQWDAQVSQYWITRQTYNPAFVGSSSMLNIAVAGRQQWTGMQGANTPKTLWASAEMPLELGGKVHGVGVNMVSDKVGLFNNTYLNGQYAFKRKVGKATLNAGVQLGIASINFDATGLYTPSSGYHNSSDEALPTSNEKASVADIAVGITWLAPNYFVGVSTTHLLSPTYTLGEKYEARLPRTYYLVGGCNIRLSNPLFEVLPSALFKATGNIWQVDASLRGVYNKLLTAGLSWRKDAGFILLVGASIKGFHLGYSYDLATSEIARVSGGSHELSITYSMPVQLSKPKRHSAKSVRLL